ncbi:MAG: type II toxin-antitoxin system VapC family toxin [Candidatus Aenigmarchaeota archaeon]|nr:type II toxin-antitoxin system VapC family toxin [Candidatus Aenigmarchaeota archaeon]
MLFLDANFFVFANFDLGEKGKRARSLQKEIIARRDACTSVLALDEVMWVVVRNNKKDQLKNIIEEIYATPHLTVKEVPVLAPLAALEIMETCNLRPRDAIHAATMKAFGLHEIATDDRDFDKVDWITRVHF